MSSIVDTIYAAEIGAYEIEQVSESFGAFDIPTAYRYQKELVERYLAERKSVICGYKMGLTSREKMEQMGVDAPVHGVLFEEMWLRDGVYRFAQLIHPKAEPEIAVKFACDVPFEASTEELASCIGFVAPAIDIIDSRYKDFKFTMADVVADNCSSAQFAIGEWMAFNEFSCGRDALTCLDAIHATLSLNGDVLREGVSSAVLGSPLSALVELQRSLAADGVALRAGQVVLTGAITAAERFELGDTVTNSTDLLGSVSISAT